MQDHGTHTEAACQHAALKAARHRVVADLARELAAAGRGPTGFARRVREAGDRGQALLTLAHQTNEATGRRREQLDRLLENAAADFLASPTERLRDRRMAAAVRRQLAGMAH